MFIRAKASPLDPNVLEERTQVIGHELFALAKREHAHLSALNRWTAAVLSWCLSDSTLKGQVLRFIDTLPSLATPHDIARHVREYFPSTRTLPPALRFGSELARPGLVTHGALAAVIRQLVEQVARQFIAESTPEGAAHVIRTLAVRGATCSLDILGEQVLSEVEADRYVTQCGTLLQESARTQTGLPASQLLHTCGPRVNLSVKPSALSPRFDPISPTDSIARATRRLLPLLQRAAEHRALINLDMEQYELRDVTLELAKQLLVHPAAGAETQLGVVVQAYLCDADAVVEALLAWLASHERALTIRLVKGAYWDHEIANASQHHWPIPVYQQKAATDAAFERLTRRLLGAHPLVMTAIASHNVRSIAHAMAVAELLDLPNDQLEFQLLYGMGDAIHAAIIARGYPVRIYTPIGALIPGMAYLVRRILENAANESFLRQGFFQERSAEELLRPPQGVPDMEPSAFSSVSHVWVGDPWLDFSKTRVQDRLTQSLTAVAKWLGHTYPLLLGDRSLDSGETLTVRNPARPTDIVGSVVCAQLDQVREAVEIAHTAQSSWEKTLVPERVACLRRAADLIRARREELAAWEILEVGKTWREADADILEAIEYLEYYSQQMERLAAGKSLSHVPGERNLYRYLSRGVAVVIAPWNFPAAILTGMTSAALVTGNAVILKPAEESSIIAAHLTQIFRDAGIPPAVIQCLPGPGGTIGAALVQHPQVHSVLFTGSKAVGLSIIASCARLQPGQRFIKHVVAEMGGKNAVIIDADADLDAAIHGVLRSAFGYGGQKCSAASRLIVHRAVAERLLSRLSAAVDRLVVGDPCDPATDLGPLITNAAQRRLAEASSHAQEVARVVYQYPVDRLPREGYFVGPMIVSDVPRGDRLATEELFGPLLCVFQVDSFEEALALANDSDYALTGGVYTRSPSHMARAIDAFDVGNLYINRPITGAMIGRQPFGGHRLSGLGTKAGGPDYLLQLLIPKTICMNTTRHGTPLE